MTHEQRKWLMWLSDGGGSAYVDRCGRLVSAGRVAPQGTQTTWLKLLALGYIRGGGERIQITIEGNFAKYDKP